MKRLLTLTILLASLAFCGVSHAGSADLIGSSELYIFCPTNLYVPAVKNIVAEGILAEMGLENIQYSKQIVAGMVTSEYWFETASPTTIWVGRKIHGARADRLFKQAGFMSLTRLQSREQSIKSDLILAGHSDAAAALSIKYIPYIVKVRAGYTIDVVAAQALGLERVPEE